MYMMMKKQMSDQSTEEEEDFFSFSWFVFDLIIKSMVLRLREQGMLGGNLYIKNVKLKLYR